MRATRWAGAKLFPCSRRANWLKVSLFSLLFRFTTADSSSLRYGKHFRIIIKVLKLAENPLEFRPGPSTIAPEGGVESRRGATSVKSRSLKERKYLKNISDSKDGALFPPSAFENYSANTRKKRRAFSGLTRDQRSRAMWILGRHNTAANPGSWCLNQHTDGAAFHHFRLLIVSQMFSYHRFSVRDSARWWEMPGTESGTDEE